MIQFLKLYKNWKLPDTGNHGSECQSKRIYYIYYYDTNYSRGHQLKFLKGQIRNLEIFRGSSKLQTLVKTNEQKWLITTPYRMILYFVYFFLCFAGQIKFVHGPYATRGPSIGDPYCSIE